MCVCVCVYYTCARARMCVLVCICIFVRLYVYDLLRRIFIEEPSTDLLAFIKSISVHEFLPEHLFEGATICHLLESTVDSLKDIDIDEKSCDFQDMHWDYTRLFIGPHAVPAKPWESSYKNDKLLFTETTYQVECFYNKHGFYLYDNEKEAADHIGYELDFIYHLNKKLHAIENPLLIEVKENLSTQIKFLYKHILSFSEQLMNNISKNAESYFYKNISLFAAEFLKNDFKKINSLLMEI